MSRWARKAQRATERSSKVVKTHYLLPGDPIVETDLSTVVRLDSSPGAASVTVLLHHEVSLADAASELRILADELESTSIS